MIRNAIISVHNKTNLDTFARFLVKKNVTIYSSGGTYNFLKSKGIPLINLEQISSLTRFPEILNGRVKTLHPMIYGGLLAKRDNVEHMTELTNHGIPQMDLAVVNLYPFEEVVKSNKDNEELLLENVDIGGHTLIRASAKNYKDVLVVVDPNDYALVENEFDNIDKKYFAKKAFRYITNYDIAISGYFNDEMVYRQYIKSKALKYGLNPQQKFAGIYYNNQIQDKLPFETLNGNPGYINFLDAIYSWNLVVEIKNSLNMCACASFKHTSPAGVGLSIELDDKLKEIYYVANRKLTPVATAYLRARNGDPMCSYGDFVAINDIVDLCTAKLILGDVSDGIVALGYTPEALAILKKKKNGTYVILQGKCDKVADIELRELHGVTLIQESNKQLTTYDSLNNIVTNNKYLTSDAIVDLILANITIKYTQSNSIVATLNGQVIGVGAGQQSRIDCVKLVKKKIINWWLRQHPFCLDLMKNFKKSILKQAKVNAIIRYIENDFTEIEYMDWLGLFESKPQELTDKEKKEFIAKLNSVSLSSDAFLPFRDNVDVASQFGVKYIVQPGEVYAMKK